LRARRKRGKQHILLLESGQGFGLPLLSLDESFATLVTMLDRGPRQR
jgi:hypothetical protein